MSTAIEKHTPNRSSGGIKSNANVRYALLPLLLLVLLIHFPPYADSFFLDDFKHLEFIQPFADRPWRAWRIASPFWLGWYYRPVQNWLILFNRLLYDVQPAGYYMTSLALNSLNVVLLYKVARLNRVTRVGAVLAAALFALHQLHYDVSGWISSASIVAAGTGALVALYAFWRHLGNGTRRWLAFSFLGIVLALLAREESIVLPFVLLLLSWDHHRALREKGDRAPLVFFLVLFLGMLAYFYFQAVRPSWTFDPGSGLGWQWWVGLQRGEPLRYLFHVAVVLFLPVLPIEQLPVTLQQAGGLLFGLTGLLYWWRSGRFVRLVLLWSAAYLGVVYLLLWSLNPALFAPRYLYLPWLGLSLTLGITLARVASNVSRASVLRYAPVGFIAVFLLMQISQTRVAQGRVLAHTRHMQSVQEQLYALAPKPPANAHFFTHQFPDTPDYVQAMASVWYETAFPQPGGSLPRLLAHGHATPAFYVLNYEDGQLYNLMPELQESEQTIFAWDSSPVAELRHEDESASPLPQVRYAVARVAGPPGDHRLALYMEAPADGWASLAYEITVPQDSMLQTSVLNAATSGAGQEEVVFRLLLQPEDESTVVLWESGPGLPGTEWQDVSVDVSDFWWQRVTLRFEVSGEGGYWANPRFAIGSVPE